MNRAQDDGGLYVAALLGGALLWLGTMAISGRNEAWDSLLYWKAAYPMAIALSGVLGYLGPVRPWRWALTVILVQPLVMESTSGGSFGLLPLDIATFLILAVPAVLVAWIASAIRSGARKAR